MKRIVLLVLIASLLLASCSKIETDEKDESTQNATSETTQQTEISTTIKEGENVLDEKTQKTLKNSAVLLTKATVCASQGFSSDPKHPSIKLFSPSDKNQTDIVNFIIMIMYNSNPKNTPESKDTIYKDMIYIDNNGVYHMNKSYIPVILKDAFDIKSYDESIKIMEEQLDFKYDKGKNEYLSTLEFGNNINWFCKDIQDIKIDTDKQEITVKYSAENEFSFADSDEEEITKYICENKYGYAKKDSGEYYLKLKSIEIKDYIKENNK